MVLLKTTMEMKEFWRASLEPPLGFARFDENLQNFSERQILWRLYSVVFNTEMPIPTSLSVAPKLPVSLSSHEKCPNFRKTSTLLEYLLFHDVYGFCKLGPRHCGDNLDRMAVRAGADPGFPVDGAPTFRWGGGAPFL